MEEKRDELTELFYRCLEELNINVSTCEISKFLTYKDLLISWNEKMNLTAIKDDREIIIKHFADSLSLLEFIGNNKKVIDVGTGAGFPGVPLKIMKDDIELSLLDSQKKRIVFLENLLDKLSIEDVIFINERAETAGRHINYRERYDISLSRAVAALPLLLEYCLPFVKVGGYFLSMKGVDSYDEISEAKGALYLLGADVSNVKSFNVCGNSRTIIEIIKTKSTPVQYPRRPGIPAKRPLSNNVLKKG